MDKKWQVENPIVYIFELNLLPGAYIEVCAHNHTFIWSFGFWCLSELQLGDGIPSNA